MMAKEKLSNNVSDLGANEIKKTAKMTRSRIVVNIDDYKGAMTIMQNILDGKIRKDRITKKIVKDLAKAGVFHKGNSIIMGYLLIDDYMDIFGDILSKDDVDFLINKSYEIEKVKNTHSGRSVFEIEDEIDKYFKQNKKLAA